jgi:hypothetical protein
MADRIVDLPRGASGDAELAGRLAALDVALRLSLGAAWIAAAALATPALLGAQPALGLALAACGVAALVDALPRTTAAAGLAVSLLALPAGPALAPWLALLGAAAARAGLQLDPCGALLARGRALRHARAAALVATEIHRRQAAGAPDAAAQAALGRAGDAFELAGRARDALAALGIEGRAGAALARAAGGAAARLAPAVLAGRLADRLAAASRRQLARAGFPT